MKDLFGYPYSPGYEDVDTSREAAASIAGHVAAMCAKVYAEFVICGTATCDEIEARLGMRHQTCSARIRDLVLMGKLVDTGQRRLTRSRRSARVYEIKMAP